MIALKEVPTLFSGVDSLALYKQSRQYKTPKTKDTVKQTAKQNTMETRRQGKALVTKVE